MRIAFAFDLDGVILDSLAVLREVYFKFLASYGVSGSDKEFSTLNGPSLPEIVTILKQNYGLPETHDNLLVTYRALLREMYLFAPLVFNAKECLFFLRKKNTPVALVTSSMRSEVNFILQNHGITDYFDFIITGDDVLNSKPAPDIYLKLREKFPEYSFIAIEDSENGLSAAIKAGLKTIFFDPHGMGTKKEVICRTRSMCALKLRLEELHFECCVNEISSEIVVLIEENSWTFNKVINDRVNEIWEMNLQNTHLHEGSILYYLSHQVVREKCTIKAFWGSYRYFYARQQDPSLLIPLYPLSVSGVCIKENGQVLTGERSKVTEYSGLIELVPSGGLTVNNSIKNTVNYFDQLIDELEEETDLNREQVDSINPLGLVTDFNHGVVDIVCLIRIKPNSDVFLNSTAEYRKLSWKCPDEISLNRLVPTSRASLNLIV